MVPWHTMWKYFKPWMPEPPASQVCHRTLHMLLFHCRLSPVQDDFKVPPAFFSPPFKGMDLDHKGMWIRAFKHLKTFKEPKEDNLDA